MADQQRTDTPPTEGQGQQTRGGRASGRGAPGSTNVESTQSGSGQSAQQGGDQERQRQVSRESNSGSMGMQRGGGRQTGSSLAGRGEPSLLPAFMSNPGLMASAFMSNPFAFAQAMSQEMDRLFDTFGGTSQGGRGLSASGSGRSVQQQGDRQMGAQRGRSLASWAPQMEVLRREHEIVVRADLPGMTPHDVQIDIEDGVLTISGERRQTNEEREEGFYHTERSYGSFARSIALPEGVDEEKVNARFEHGVLEVTVPLPEQQRQRGRRVQIQSPVGAGQSANQSSSQGSSQSAGQSASQSTGQSASKTAGQSATQQGTGQQAGGQPGAGGASSM